MEGHLNARLLAILPLSNKYYGAWWCLFLQAERREKKTNWGRLFKLCIPFYKWKKKGKNEKKCHLSETVSFTLWWSYMEDGLTNGPLDYSSSNCRRSESSPKTQSTKKAWGRIRRDQREGENTDLKASPRQLDNLTGMGRPHLTAITVHPLASSFP